MIYHTYRFFVTICFWVKVRAKQWSNFWFRSILNDHGLLTKEWNDTSNSRANQLWQNNHRVVKDMLPANILVFHSSDVVSKSYSRVEMAQAKMSEHDLYCKVWQTHRKCFDNIRSKKDIDLILGYSVRPVDTNRKDNASKCLK